MREEKALQKDIKEPFNRLGLRMGPWSSWLTPVEAKRRFPHAEEIAGSTPAGPTNNHLSTAQLQSFSPIFFAISFKSLFSGFLGPWCSIIAPRALEMASPLNLGMIWM